MECDVNDLILIELNSQMIDMAKLFINTLYAESSSANITTVGANASFADQLKYYCDDSVDYVDSMCILWNTAQGYPVGLRYFTINECHPSERDSSMTLRLQYWISHSIDNVGDVKAWLSDNLNKAIKSTKQECDALNYRVSFQRRSSDVTHSN